MNERTDEPPTALTVYSGLGRRIRLGPRASAGGKIIMRIDPGVRPAIFAALYLTISELGLYEAAAIFGAFRGLTSPASSS